MRSLLTTTSLVLVLILAAIPSLRVMAADCTTVLSDVTPAANMTITVQSGECAGNIKIANDGVKIIFQPGAGEFQAEKSIVLPTAGVIVNFNLTVTGVNWAVSQKVFSGGHATALEFRGADVKLQASSITSSVSDPIGFSAALTGSSRYTVSTTTVSVVHHESEGYGVYFGAIISGSSTVTVSSSTVSCSSGGYCYGLWFNAAVTSSTLSITDGSVSATSSDWAVNAIRIHGAFTDSTLSMTDGSALTATGKYAAWAIRFVAPFTDSTLVMKHGSSVQATGSYGNAYGIYFDAAFSTESTLCVTDDSVMKATGPRDGNAVVYPSTMENGCSSVGWPSGNGEEVYTPSADGNGAPSVTAAVLGLVTVVLAAF